MKHFLIAICLFFPLLAVAQNNYQIKNIQGEVTMRHADEKTWATAKVLSYVSLDDILNIEKDGVVTLIEKSTGRVFVSTETGKVSVQDRLVNAEKKAQSLFSTLNSELGRSIKNQHESRPYVSMAAVTRGCDTCPVQTDLYDSIYTSIMQFIQDKNVIEPSVFVVKKSNITNDDFTITIKNNSNKLLYFNAVHITDNHPSVCYYFDNMDFIPLQPGATVDLTSFPLVSNQGEYIIVASEINLSVELLEATFEGEPIISSCELPSLRLSAL